MKIEHLYLKAFGAFSERRLDFTGGPDFHVIYGPNEAGKSTTLRALVGLLFGIEERTADDFVHSKPNLRIGAALATDAGRLAIMRRKGRKQTLFALDEVGGEEQTDQPLAEDMLTRLLGGLDEGLYRALFGLDHDELIRGGEALLEGKGDIGQSLFAAAAGLADLRQLSGKLEVEASDLFNPRGKKNEIQVALKELEEQRKRAREATVRSSTWEQTERIKRQAEKKHAELRAELNRGREEQRRLSRIIAHLPLAAERSAKLQELATLATVPLLPPEAGQQRIETEERLRAAADNQKEARLALEELRRQRAQLVVREALLSHAGAIERLHHAANDYRGTLERLPRIEADLDVARQICVGQLVEIDPALAMDLAPTELSERSRTLAPVPTARAQVQALLEEYDKRSVQSEQLEERERELTDMSQRLRDELEIQPVPVPFEALEQAREQAAAPGDLTGQCIRLEREIAALETALVHEAASLWEGTLDELIALRVPPLATVTEIADRYRQWAEVERSLRNQDGILQRDIGERERELRTLAAAAEIVTHDQVRQARQTRDEGWRRIRRSYVERTTTEPAPGQSPLDAFEAAMREADRLADLLHADAKRATSVENLRQRIVDMQRARSDCVGQFADLAAERDRLDTRWKGIAESLRQPDLSPGAAAEWLGKQALLVERSAHLETLRRERREIGAALAVARQTLDRALRKCGLPALSDDEALSVALGRAKVAIEQGRQTAMARAKLDNGIRQCEAERREVAAKRAGLAEKQAVWQAQWGAAMRELRLSPQALPAEARVRLDQWDRLAQTLQKLESLSGEVRREQTTRADFENALAELMRAVGETATDRTADRIADTLYTALSEARDADRRRKQADAAIARERQRLDQAETAAANQRDRLAELLRRAGVDSPDELAVVEEQATHKRRLAERVIEIEEQLVRGAARPLAEVLAEIEGEDLDAAHARLDELETTIRERETELETAHADCLEARRAFDAIDGGDVAAQAQQGAEETAARIARQSRVYARARLAGAVVSRVVQAYREQHQGPVLRRASEIFARITLGSFSGLEMDYQDDRQILVGKRPDEIKVGMDGLSQGTRDQLFLALRVAAIEEHLREREAVPIAIDDLLVQFDDDRAVATLGVLAELARRAQVLFFTHHGHLCELATAALPPDAWRRHDLSADPGSLAMKVRP